MALAALAGRQPHRVIEEGVANPMVARPLLRWAGGKQHLLPKLLERFQGAKAGGKYVEPFLGAASLFLGTAPSKSLIADLNYHLVDFYAALTANPLGVWRELEGLARSPVSAERYYEVREKYNRSKPSARQAARFLYLNKTSFNGIFRVNTRGEFNVPFGKKFDPALPSKSELFAAAAALSRAKLRHQGYEDTLADVSSGDSMFLDPPYPPSSKTAYFAHYTTTRFSEFDQHRLAAQVKSLDRSGAKFMMTNADCPLIRKLYAGFEIEALSVTRWVSCRAQKPVVSELIIHNY